MVESSCIRKAIPLRILVIGQLPPPIHGSNLMARVLTSALDSLGHRWKLVDRRFSKSVEEVGIFGMRKVASAPLLLTRLFASMLSFRPDCVVFFATNRTLSFLMDCLIAETLRRFDTRRIFYLHTVGYMSLASRGFVWELLVRRLLRCADTVVVLGPSLSSDVLKWVDESRIVYIPNTIADLEAQWGDDASNGSKTILFLSNLIPEKGADVFIDTALEVMRDHPEARAVLAGAPVDIQVLRNLEAEIFKSDVGSQISILGGVKDAEAKWALLKRATLLAFPTRYPYEAQPLTILEALSVGTPVVAFDVGGIRDVVRDGVDGFLVPAGDRDEFVKAIRALVEFDDFDRRKAIKEGYERRFSRRTYESNWKRLLDAYAD